MELSAFEILLLQQKLDLNSIPTTRAGISLRAKTENWEFRYKKSQGGKNGLKRVYKLPKYLVQEIAEKSIKQHGPQGGAFSIKDLIGEVNEDRPIETTGIKEPSNQYTVPDNDDDYLAWAKKQDKDDIIPIRYYKNVYASAGNGFFNFDESVDVMWFRRSFIEGYLRRNPRNLICTRSRGDSMYPTIKPDGTVLFDLSMKYAGEGIYLIRQGDELKVKRLQKATSTKMLIVSDNSLYDTIEIDLAKTSIEEFEVLAEYLWDAGISK